MNSLIEKRRRPGGRTARSTDAIHAAVEILLSERQPGEITMPMIAERSGMAPTSLYRRWGDVRTLLLEASVAHLVLEHPLQNTGSVRGDLSAWAKEVSRSLADSKSAVFLRIQLGFGAAGPESLQAMTPRLDQIEEVLARGRSRGEITPDLLQVADHLLSPLYMRALFGAPANEAAAVGFVDDVLRLAQSSSVL